MSRYFLLSVIAMISFMPLPAVGQDLANALVFQLQQADTEVAVVAPGESLVSATRTFYRGGEIVALDEVHTGSGDALLGMRAQVLDGQPDGDYRVVIDAQAEVDGKSLTGRGVVSFHLSGGDIYIEDLGGKPPRLEGWRRAKGILLPPPGPDPDAVPFDGTEPEDPGTMVTYPCYFIWNLTWNFPDDQPAVQGQLRFPSQTCQQSDGPPANRPVMIFAHGLGMDHLDHTYLMAHLARNGIVTVSIVNSGDNETRGKQMVSYLNGLNAFWQWAGRLSGDVAFAGHSRGGEGAATAARLVSEGLGASPYNVRAVISLAPTDGGGTNGSDPREDLSGAMTAGYLAIYGSSDTDVNGSAAVPANLEPQKTAFATYDRAGVEFSSEGFQIFGTHVQKAFVFLINAGHGDFKNVGMVLGDGTTEGTSTARAYFNAFLRWMIWDQDQYRGFFDGAWRPDAIEGSDVRQQFSAGLRRVIDDFENGNGGLSAIGDTVIHTSPITFLEGNLHQTISSSPHQSGGLRVTWATDEWVRWGIPNISPLGVGPLRDVSAYTHLSLRLTQVYGNIFNTEGEDQDLHVRIFSGSGFSNKARLGAYGRLPYPDEFICNDVLNACLGDFSKSAMSTVRFPLTAFKNVDWTDVRSVYLYFDVPGHDRGAIAIDSLEFNDGPQNGMAIFADGFESGDTIAWD